MSQENATVQVDLRQLEKYRFELSFDQPSGAALIVDEGPPLGQSAGPNPARLLAAAVGHCLSASFIFCLDKARQPIAAGIKTHVEATIGRNAEKRLRILGIVVDIRLPLEAQAFARELARCEKIFESYCTVTASIRGSVPVTVKIDGRELPQPS